MTAESPLPGAWYTLVQTEDQRVNLLQIPNH